MSKEQVVAFATWKIRPGARDQVIALIGKAVTASRQEPGNIEYRAHQSTTDPDTIVLYEVYADDAAVSAHRESAHFQEIVVGQIVPLLERREVVVSRAL